MKSSVNAVKKRLKRLKWIVTCEMEGKRVELAGNAHEIECKCSEKEGNAHEIECKYHENEGKPHKFKSTSATLKKKNSLPMQESEARTANHYP